MSEKNKPKKLDEKTAEALSEAFNTELLREILVELRAVNEKLEAVTTNPHDGAAILTVDKYR